MRYIEALRSMHGHERLLVSKLESYLNEKGFGLFSEEQILEISDTYSNALIAALHGDRSMGLAMGDSRIKQVPFGLIPENENSLVLVIGGTNLRAALVSMGVGKVPQITRENDGRARYMQTNVPRRNFRDASDPAQEFYRSMIQELDGFIRTIDPETISALSIIYSFRGTPVEHNGHLDMMPDEAMGKEFVVPGISEYPVGKMILNTASMKAFKGIQKIMVMNDMPPVCVAAEASMGMILATGLNTATEIDGTYWVTECGHYNQLPTNNYAKLVDQQSEKPGYGLMEKQTSGHYLGTLFGYVLEDAIRENLIPVSLPPNVRWGSEQVGKFILDGPRGFTPEVKAGMKYIAQLVAWRSAQLIGANLGTTIHTFPDSFEADQVIKIPVEGALLYKIPRYQEIASYYAQLISGKRVEFVNIERADVIGAGLSSLSL